MKTQRIPSGIKFAVAALMAGSTALLVGCGDTSTTETSPVAGGIGGNGSNGRVTIEFVDSTIRTGDTTGFFVRLTDASGRPVPFIRMFCESERGLAIIEPSAGGVAFESTDENGEFSGRLGGITPGSYLIECRAQQGFNVVARKTMIVQGPVPQGFAGFPGAAGGNLGGGSVQPPPAGNEGIRITNVVYQQNGEDTFFLDSTRNCNCAGSATVTAVDPEPFTGVRAVVTLQNTTASQFRVNRVNISGIRTGQLAISTAIIPPGGTGTITLAVAGTSGVCATDGSTITQFSVLSPALTSADAVITVIGTGDGDSNEISVSATNTIGVANLDNCGA